MKKLLKIMVVVFVVTGVCSVISAKAYTGYVGFVGVEIPNFQRVYVGPLATKETERQQYARKNRANDSLSYQERAIDAQVCLGDHCTDWLELPKGQLRTWGDTQTQADTDYRIQLRNGTSLLTGSSFYGDWYLDY